MSEKFDQLIRVLQKELKLTGTEIAEILWLAQQTSSNFSGQKTQDSSHDPETRVKDITEDITEDITNKLSDSTLTNSLRKTPVNDKDPQVSTAVVTPQTSKTFSGSSLSIKLPDRSSLPYPLKIAKALRPLIQYIAFGKAVLLDENATVELIAELNGVCIPVLKPRLELRFDLTVVIDKSDSMIFWQSITKELEQILKHYGIFRNIQTFGMVENEQGDICLKQETSKKNYSTQKLIDPSGRRLILVVSDCVSQIWRNGKAFDLLKIWGKHNVVAIVQMLPEKMWLRTGLSLGTMVQLDSLIPAVSNRNLFIREILIWDYIDQNSIKVPVFSLTQDSIETWSEMVTGKGNMGAGGFVFSSLQEQEKESDKQSQLTAEERIYNFRVSSSPVARKLASLLASAPVINLPVVRLIQNLINKNKNSELPQINVIAEVFLGGILKPTEEITPDTEPDYVQYHFIDEKIRDSLLPDSSRVKSLEIIEVISEYFAKQLGKNLKEFYALLKKPDELEKLKTEKNVTDFDVKHFATITTKVLKRLGGDYARFAEEIEQSQSRLVISEP
ncbi:SAV_2336 N-terminal domain-related protein [Nodularia spumigena CS-591/04]|nr:SAV_2336 N-terminal domain-related protein [Nodularia spumigena]MDB9321267.1 SAV_2336 N-terminal domain-related protein [Nodularia spumigena CS-591/07A]MDB9331200.1 SAV_2336 N-terminal domain-related protein [Nodularia spumigena CS-591/04]MDB9362846.1 SAV_2336 N-terminal domain-related protein [Nodularia spumigena CS-588/02]MDB9364682.1 SAV_2336 N-terminal domain-related protein [Nodularia spumigena CS-588/02A10]